MGGPIGGTERDGGCPVSIAKRLRHPPEHHSLSAVELPAHSLRGGVRPLLCSAIALLACAACSSGEGGSASRRAGAPEEDVPLGFVEEPADPGATPGELAPLDAHAVLGIEPAHGPFRGGQLAVIRGNGFSSQARIWFGDVEVPAEQVTATRADRVQVTVPAGLPGSVAVSAQNGDDPGSRRELAAAYVYDAFYAEPERGPTSGGSTITLHGLGTAWDTTSIVQVDQQACEVLEVRGDAGGEQSLDCRLPAGTEGSKTIRVQTGAATDSVLGGFLYEPGAAPLGGLSGEPLAGRLSVHVTGPGGVPVPEAYVILGSDLDLASLGQPGANVRQTDAAGDVVFESGDLIDGETLLGGAGALVTVAARCFQPTSFVDVPVDTVRAELDAVASPDCGDALSGGFFGGSPSLPVFIQGELVWQGGVEFQRSNWNNVPIEQAPGERRAAYIFQPSGNPEAEFRLPRQEDAITLDSPGRTGYEFRMVTGAGGRTLYALAGIENRSEIPTRFTAYAMGLVRGLYANPGDSIEGLAIVMDRTIDQALRFDIVGPAPGARGPDRVAVRAAVQVAGEGYAILPNTELQAPVSGGSGLSIVGLPALGGALEGSRYVVGARAYTGVAGSAPSSVLSLITAAESSQTIAIDGFLPVPTLSVGATDALTWNGELGVAFEDASARVSLIRYELRSGGGLVSWSVAAPPGHRAVRLPDLSRLPEGGLIAGTLDVSVSLASVTELDYSALTSEQLSRFSWQAYATDVARARYEPSAP